MKTHKPTQFETFRTFDIEARDWNKYLIGGSYDILNDDYCTHKSIPDFIDFIFSTENHATKIYSHFGGIYDFLFILDFYLNNTDKYFFHNIINQGSKILAFRLTKLGTKKTKRTIEFICTSGLFPFGLKDLTEMFHVEHKKLDEDVSNLTKITPKLLKYLENDCKGLAEVLLAYSNSPYINQVGMKLTRSSQSLAVFKEFFCSNLPEVSKQVSNFAREAYLGGRTEIFKPIFEGNKNKKLYEMDLNSLYPSVMHDFTYPAEFSHFSTELDLDHEHFIIHCLITAPDIEFPLLGIKNNGKFIFPTGTFEGHWCSPEIRKALYMGYKIETIYRVCYFHSAGYIFKDFINTFYSKRLETDNPIEKIIYKDFMNHLYGRLAIREEREIFTFKKGKNSVIHCDYDFKDYSVRLYKEEKTLMTYSNPALSAFVTSYGRLRLYEYFEKVNFDVYYCDTDSIYSTKKLPSSMKLGEMKLEAIWDRACFLLPKTYVKYAIDTKKFDIKMKGFPSKKGELSHLTYDDYKNHLEGISKLPAIRVTKGLARFKTGLKKNNVLTVLDDQNRELKALYDKRIIVKTKKDWLTKPIHLEYQISLF